MTAGREHPVDQGAYCPACGRYIARLVDERLVCHTPLDDPYGTCPCDMPAVAVNRRGRPRTMSPRSLP